MSTEQIVLILGSAGLCLGVLICFILFLSNQTQVHANRLLGITLLCLTLAILQAVLIYSGYLIKIPYFFRISSPFYYLSLSTSYLYVRAVVNDETRFKKYDAFLFLPAFLHLIEMIPFYLKPAAEKREIIKELLQNPGQIAQLNEGILPPYLHNLLRALMGMVFVTLMVRLLIKKARVSDRALLHSPIFNWLKWFTGLVGLAVISVLLILLVPQSAHFNKTLGIHLSVIICFLVCSFYLFFRPEILYGIPKLRMESVRVPGDQMGKASPHQLHGKAFQQVEKSSQENDDERSPSSLEYLLAYKPMLEQHLDSQKPYLQQGYNIAKLSLETGIPQHHLSALLNKVYGVRFNDFINQYRIRHIANHYDKSGWEQMTLEGIASEAGFNSRTTFFNAIKKSTGLSPSEFIGKIKMKSVSSQQVNATENPP